MQTNNLIQHYWHQGYKEVPVFLLATNLFHQFPLGLLTLLSQQVPKTPTFTITVGQYPQVILITFRYFNM